jgi:hypothetical protein
MCYAVRSSQKFLQIVFIEHVEPENMAETFIGRVTIAQGASAGGSGPEDAIPIDIPKVILNAGEPDHPASSISVLDNASKPSIYLSGEGHSILVIEPIKSGGKIAVQIQTVENRYAELILGSIDGTHGRVAIRNRSGKESIVLDGSNGDIFLSNADCAEDFDVSDSGEIEPGTVMVINQEGKLQKSSKTYDKRVAGVISGAGDFKPGLVLDKKQSQNTRQSISLIGKVYCKVDAQFSPIEVGDLLTTSSTAGHAMKATDPIEAFGAVIGKALKPLRVGRGIIPVLVALQ